MTIADIIDFLQFWKSIGFYKFLRFFWYAILLEFPRYVVFDMIFLIVFNIQRYLRKDAYALARLRLFNMSPLVSILVPGKNEGENIFKLSKSLKEQTYKNIEIIIADDGSDDNTPEICNDLVRNGLIDKYLRNDFSGGKASVSNLALRYARGSLVLLLDADSSFDRDAIEKSLIPFYLDERVGAVGGNVKVRNHGSSLCTTLQTIEYLKSISVGRAVASLLGIYRTVPGAFGAFRRDILDRIGGWDVGPGLDGDITVKIRKLGYRIHFEKDAICFTTVPENFKSLTKQRLRWYKSLVRFRLRKHSDVFLPTENFSVFNFISFVENVFFNVLLDFKWFIYVIDMFYNAPSLVKYILPMNYVLYVIFNFMQYGVVTALTERKEKESHLFMYLPLMPFYMGYYMRAVRTVAYTQEFLFKSSYKDPWNPWKVSRRVLKERL